MNFACHRSIRLLALMFTVLLAVGMVADLASAAPSSATPVASPVADGCDALGPYFQEVAALVRDNEGYAIMRDAAFDALALTDAEAAIVVTSLDILLPRLDAIAPPDSARAWYDAYRGQLAWYRDLAANRDPLAHQQLINRDRQVFTQMGRGVLAGQAACGYDFWNDAWAAAFTLPE